MKLSDSGLMRKHIKNMIDIFNELTVVEPASDEDKVVYILKGLPE